MYPEPLGRQSAIVITYDLIRRTGIQDAHARYLLEEGIQRSFPVCGWRRGNAGQPLLDGAFHRGFDIFPGQTGKTLRELINLGGTDVHGPPRQREQQAYHPWGLRSLPFAWGITDAAERI